MNDTTRSRRQLLYLAAISLSIMLAIPFLFFSLGELSCHLLSTRKDECFMAVAEGKNSIRVCAKIADSDSRDVCYLQIALNRMDERICDEAGSRSGRCYYHLGRLRQDFSLCDKAEGYYGSVTNRDNCYRVISYDRCDASFCDQTGEESDFCKESASKPDCTPKTLTDVESIYDLQSFGERNRIPLMSHDCIGRLHTTSVLGQGLLPQDLFPAEHSCCRHICISPLDLPMLFGKPVLTQQSCRSVLQHRAISRRLFALLHLCHATPCS